MPPAYRASLTREPFLFREMRVTAREVLAGADDAAVIERISSQNLYQYPTERSLRGMARACLRRLHLLGDAGAVRLIAEAPAALSRQLCLYALMKDSRLVAECLVQVVGEKYRQHDPSLSRADVHAFFLRLQEQSDQVAAWSESTIQKLTSVLMNVLVQNGYLATPRSHDLQPVTAAPAVRDLIKKNGDEMLLAAFL